VEIDLKLPPRPPGFAFVEFAHSRDAQDAVDGRDGYDFYGSRLRVRLDVGFMSQQSPCQQPGVSRTLLQPAALCFLGYAWLLRRSTHMLSGQHQK